MDDTLKKVTDILCSVGNLPSVAHDQDFYEAGLTSVMALMLLMELEGAFEVSIPDQKFIAARTADALSSVIAELKALKSE